MLSIEQLRSAVLSHIPEAAADFNDSEHLVDYGLDSLSVVEIVAFIQQQGVSVELAELLELPCLEQWWRLVESRRSQLA